MYKKHLGVATFGAIVTLGATTVAAHAEETDPVTSAEDTAIVLNQTTEKTSVETKTERVETEASKLVDSEGSVANTEEAIKDVTDSVNNADIISNLDDEQFGITQKTQELEKALNDSKNSAGKHIENTEDHLKSAKEDGKAIDEQNEIANSAVEDAKNASQTADRVVTNGQSKIDAKTEEMRNASNNEESQKAFNDAWNIKDAVEKKVEEQKKIYEGAVEAYKKAVEESSRLGVIFDEKIAAAKAEAEKALETLNEYERLAQEVVKASQGLFEKYEAMAADGGIDKARTILELEEADKNSASFDQNTINTLFESIIRDYYFPIEAADSGEKIEVEQVQSVSGGESQNYYKIIYTLEKDGVKETKTNYVAYHLKTEKDQIVIEEKELVGVTKEIVEKDGNTLYIVDGTAYTRDDMLNNPDFTELADGSFVKFVKNETRAVEELVEEGTVDTETGRVITTIDRDNETIRYYVNDEGEIVKEVTAKVTTRTETDYVVHATEDVKDQLVYKYRMKTKTTDGKMGWDNDDLAAQRSYGWQKVVWPLVWADFIKQANADIASARTANEGTNNSVTGTITQNPMGSLRQNYEVVGIEKISVQVGFASLELSKVLGQEKYNELFSELENEYLAADTFEKRGAVISKANQVLRSFYSDAFASDSWSSKLSELLKDVNAKYAEQTHAGIVFYEKQDSFSYDNPRPNEYASNRTAAGSINTLCSLRWVDDVGFVCTGLPTDSPFVNNYYGPNITVDISREGANMTTLRNETKAAWNEVKASIYNDVKNALAQMMTQVSDYKDESFWLSRISGGYGTRAEIDYRVDKYDYTGKYTINTTATENKVIENTYGEGKQVYQPETSKEFDEYENQEFRDWVRMEEKMTYYAELTDKTKVTIEKIQTSKRDVENLIDEIDHLKRNIPNNMVDMVIRNLEVEDARKSFDVKVNLPETPKEEETVPVTYAKTDVKSVSPQTGVTTSMGAWLGTLSLSLAGLFELKKKRNSLTNKK